MWTQKHRYSMWKTTFGINCKFKWTYTTIIKSLQTTLLKFYWIFGFLLLLPYSTCLYQNPWISLLLLAFKFIWCIADSSRRRSAFKAITTSTLSWPYSVYRVHWLLQHTYTVHHQGGSCYFSFTPSLTIRALHVKIPIHPVLHNTIVDRYNYTDVST